MFVKSNWLEYVFFGLDTDRSGVFAVAHLVSGIFGKERNEGFWQMIDDVIYGKEAKFGVLN